MVLSMPAIVGKEGIESKIPIDLDANEQRELRESADTLKQVLDEIEKN